MQLEFTTRKLKRQMESETAMQKAFGGLAKRLMMRLGVLSQAKCLADVPRDPPTRLHPLKGKFEGQFAVDVSGNWRLILEPVGDEQTEDGKVDLAEVTAVRILGVVDYH